MGTDQQVDYIILKLVDGNWSYASSYENAHNRSTKSVKTRKGKNGDIILKGKYLKQITRGSVIEP